MTPKFSIAILGSILGIAIGVGLYTFVYAKGYSYMTNDPQACANCHIMQEHFSSWTKASHHSVATCNDCHTPAGFFGKYMTKASNGFWHSFAFTTGDYPDPLRIKQHNREITEEACRKCHQEIVEAIDLLEHGTGANDGGKHTGATNEPSCVRCHNTVGHWVR